jgi:cyclopropane fatty-acyl-phospholipid synthase-like methyltransferase
VKRRWIIHAPYRQTYDDAFMAKTARDYEQMTRHARMRLVNVRDLVDPQPGEKVLDLGCATGAITHFLSTYGCETVGVDYSQTGIDKARELFPHLRFELADCADLPFDGNSFDKIVAADLTEHLVDETLDGMLRESMRVLPPGGTLSIHTPNPRHLIERLKEREFLLAQNPTHIGLRTREQLEERLVRFGFEIDWSTWRPIFIPFVHTLELGLGQMTELFRYRLCIRARKPSVRAG